jgi:RNA polymerase Rpb2, domain 6/RNA polymerase Rpb1, domain 2/RNA polymerase Rpb2, domain 3
MPINTSMPWHRASFDRLVQDRLPKLLAERLPLIGYHVESTGRYTCRIEVTLAAASGNVQLTFADLPQPDEDGTLEIAGEPRVVVPTASNEELDTATFRCMGEQLYEYIEARLGQAPPDLPWDSDLARAWLPLDTWIDQFMRDKAQSLDTTNWLSRLTHLRRMITLESKQAVAPGQAGRVCPFEMPETPYFGRIFTIAVGAEIRDEKLVVVDERPEATLGLSSSMIPFLENSDPNRLLMGANMQRWVLAPPSPEPALVQTGNEPDAPNFWCGRNLLTAFVSWGADTCWDGIVISESCARRLDYPYPAEPGDRLCNRHGTTGVVSRVLPNDEMPHLPDGTPVELVFNFSGLHVRMNFGQVREAIVSRIARADGQPVVVPPFGAPSQHELRKRMAQAKLPESGMETLTLGRNGPKLERPSTVGWVYWSRTFWLAKDKVETPPDTAQMQRESDYNALRDVEAYENLREYVNTRAARRENAQAFSARVAAGPVEQAGPPSPMFADLARRLRVAGIEAALESDKLAFRFQSPQGNVLRLACPVMHPWLHERRLAEIGSLDEMEANDAQALVKPELWWMPPDHSSLPRDEYKLIVEANDRLARILSSRAPERLMQDATLQLENRVNALFDALLTPVHLRFNEPQLLGARAVITPGADLRFDHIGLADEIAWALFAPLVIREMSGDRDAVRARSERAAQALDEVMARSWVLVNHASPYTPSRTLAFHAVRNPHHVIRLHPLACGLLDADFDGDQVHVLLPITAGAQREAGERLSLVGYLARDSKLIESLLLPPEALWGLATCCLTTEGRREITRMAGIEVAMPNGVITQATLAEAMRQVLERDGADAVLSAMERLMRRGFEIVKASGASMSPFLGAALTLPPAPDRDIPEPWDAYLEELSERILSSTDYANADLGPQLLAVHIRARGRFHLPRLIGPRGAVTDIYGKPFIVRHTHVEGLTPEELYACSAGARKGLWSYWKQVESAPGASDRRESNRFTVLARARQAQHPGVVFARAAAIGEVDPLTDVDSRLLVGLPANQA